MNVQTSANPYIYPVSSLDLTGKRVVTISELYAENSFRSTLDSKLIEVNGEMIDACKLPRISFEGLQMRPEYDESLSDYSYNVKLGLDYAKTCFDFTNSWQFNDLTRAEDFTGMSAEEIYKKIYEKYQYCYGENFYSVRDIGYPLPPTDYNDYIPIVNKFRKEVLAACGTDYEGLAKLRKEALYGGMTDREIRQSIIDKYDLSDGMTFRELYHITGEMSSVGLDGGLNNDLDLLWYDVGTPWTPAKPAGHEFSEREWHLDTKVSRSYIHQLQKIYKNRSMYGNVLPDYMTALGQILEGVRY